LITIIPTDEQHGADDTMSLSAGPPDPVDVAGDPPSDGLDSQQPVADPPPPNGTNGESLHILTAAVGSLSAQVAGKDQQIRQLVAKIAASDSREQALRQQLQEVTTSRDELRVKDDARVPELEAMIALRDQNLTAREWEISSLRSQITGLEQTIKELEARLASIYASRTWVLSKKLWTVRSRVRKLIR
jgi:uncharacterized protein (DUF3084 family)